LVELYLRIYLNVLNREIIYNEIKGGKGRRELKGASMGKVGRRVKGGWWVGWSRKGGEWVEGRREVKGESRGGGQGGGGQGDWGAGGEDLIFLKDQFARDRVNSGGAPPPLGGNHAGVPHTYIYFVQCGCCHTLANTTS